MVSDGLNGGCLCGRVRYTVKNAASGVIHCHCSRCRKGHGSLITTCGIVNRDDFLVIQGQSALTRFTYPAAVHRQFCSFCGCSIIYTVEKFPDVVFYYPATLDNGVHPGHAEGTEHHIYVGSKAERELFETSLPWHNEDTDDSAYHKS